MSRAAVFKVLKAVAIVASAALAGFALYKHGRGLGESLEKVSLSALCISIFFSLVYRVLNAGGWVIILRALGVPVNTVEGVRLWLVSETMRWLPGSIWGFASRVHGAGSIGVPPAAASLSLPLELLLTIGAWFVTAVIGLGISGTGKEWLLMLTTHVPLWIPLTIIALTIVFGLLLTRMPNFGPVKKVRGLLNILQGLTKSKINWRLTSLAGLWYVAMCILNGVAFYFIVVAVTGANVSLAAVTGINAVGWLVGFFAFFAPGGIGVREATLTAMLLPFSAASGAALIALLWRLTQVLVELVCLAPCLAAPLLIQRRTATTS